MRDSSTRSSLGCSSSGSSPISSRKIVPPSAASNAPARAATAPVNAPRAWPNSSPSSRARRSAPQSTTTNGPRGARRRVVDRARHQLLAGAGLALDQHRRVGRRDARHPGEQLAHRRAGAEQAAEACRPATARPAPPRRGSAHDVGAADAQRAAVGQHAAATRTPSTKVPLRLPRSRTQTPRRSAPARRAAATPRGRRCAPARRAPSPASSAR